jgi:HK97 family phage portal protein
MGRFIDWLSKPASVPIAEHSSLASLIVSSRLQTMSVEGQRALSVAAIFRARQLNADTLASLPVKAGESLVPAPNSDQDTLEFVSETVMSMQDYGEGYWRRYDNGDLRVLDATRMHVDWDKSKTNRVYTYDDKRMRHWGLDPSLIVLPINRAAGDLTGRGPMQSGRIAGIIAEQRYVESFYLNNAQPTGLLSHPGVLDAGEAKAFVEQWEAGQGERGTAVVSGGLEYKPTSFNPADSEWVETHMVSVGDCATLFGVPSVLLNHAVSGSTLTYQAIGDVYQGYYRMTLGPTYGRRIEKAWSKVLGRPVAFDPEGLFLASLKTRADTVGVLVRAGYDPAGAVDSAGLPPLEHTGLIPTTIQTEEGAP